MEITILKKKAVVAAAPTKSFQDLDGDNSLEGKFNKKDAEVRQLAMMAAVAAAASATRTNEIFADYSRQLSAKLAEGEFVSWRKTGGDGLVYPYYEEWTILAANLPVVNPPEDWVPLVGTMGEGSDQWPNDHFYSLLRMENGEVVAKFGDWDNLFKSPNAWGILEKNGLGSFEAVVEELALTRIPHPFGWLYLDGNRPVAVSEAPGYKRESRVIMGDLQFFHEKGFARLEHNWRGRYRNEHFTCSRAIIREQQGIENLREEGWYPMKITANFIVWGTGLRLYPKNLEWNTGLEPARGYEDDPRGTRIFDSSRERLARVRRFFEAVGCAAVDPEVEYKRLANAGDPLGGRWRNSYQYPPEWTPPFAGWHISRFGEIECRWQQPRQGPARFYGVVR